MIKIIEKDIFDVFQKEANVLIHQVNCKGVMGAGIAKEIKERFPQAYKEYQKKCFAEDNPLGAAQVVYVGNNNYVVNLFGQYDFGRDKQYTDYTAIDIALSNLHTPKNFTICIPYKMGCGLAGGDWNIVFKIIENRLQNNDVLICKKVTV